MEYGLIGEHLKHSFSSEIHKKLFDYKYELFEVKKDKLDAFMDKRDFKAINVTIPYKQAVIPHLEFIDDTAKAIGAVNTVVNKNGRLYGYNTDFSGLKSLILKNGIKFENKKVLILGSGGTSKTALAVTNELKAKTALRLSRDASGDCISYEQAYLKHTDAEIIINTTPCGMYPNINESPIELDKFSRLEAVIDVIYNPLRSKLVVSATKRGIKAVGGLYMLISQAAAAGEKFTGIRLTEEKTDQVFRDLLKQKENIVLIGMPACGKSSVGKIVAHNTNRTLIDVDEEIIKRIKMPIPDYFKSFGEEAFRDIESKVLAELSSEQGLVIATGGGAILRDKNIELLKLNGKLFFINRPLQMLACTPDRPLSSNRTDLEKRFNERYKIYLSCADCVIDGSGSIENTAKTVQKEFFR